MQVIKEVVRRAVASVAPRVSGGVRVLMYHAIDDPDPADHMGLRVPRHRFHEQMTLLRDEGYSVVPLRAVLDTGADGERPRVAITFDDGYRSHEWAAVTLRQFGFPATFFLVPRFLDGVETPRTYAEAWGHLTWAEASAVMRAGFDIGAHSMTHPDLSTCTAPSLDQEVAGARSVLEQRLGCRVAHFSYPYGRHNDGVRVAVQRAGYDLACTSRYGRNPASGGSYLVNRTEVTGMDHVRTFRWKLQGKYDWLGHWQDVRSVA